MEHNNIISGNAVALAACIIMVISGYLKSKEKTLILQTIQIGLNALSCLILTAYSGMVINLLSIPRNILAQKNKLKLRYKIILLLFTVITSCIVTLQKSKAQGYLEWIGFVPLISTITYTILMDKLDDLRFKWLVIFTMVIWILHDFVVMSYVSAVFDALNIVTSLIAIHNIKIDRKNTIAHDLRKKSC